MSLFFSPSLAFTPRQKSIIEHEAATMTNYIEDIDRFFHHHRFMHCFSPRFDLEDHSHFFLLTGDIPGAKAQDIIIEPRDERTLVVSRNVHTSTSDTEEPEKSDAKPTQAAPNTENKESSTSPEETFKTPNIPSSPPSRARFPLHLSSFAHIRGGKSSGTQSESNIEKDGHAPEFTLLLNERLGTAVTRFSRTFTFPMPIEEDAIQASLEDGILRILIPKKEHHLSKPKKIIQVVQF